MSYNEIWKTYLDIIYNSQNDGLYHEKIFNTKNKIIEIDSSINFEKKKIIEEQYFTKISDKFEDYCVQIFDKMIPNFQKFQQYQKSGKEIVIDSYVKISDLLNHLEIEKTKNVDHFHDFLNMLKKSEGQLHLQISNLCPNCYQLPSYLIPKKIRIIEKSIDDYENQKFHLAEEEYQKFIEEKTSKLNDINQKYKMAKEISLSINDWRNYFNIYKIFYHRKK